MDDAIFQPIIGLEIHVELKTKSKMFCGCPADWFGSEPNTVCCPVCLGLPGALPVPNKKAVEWTVMLGLALNCKIPLFSKFDRKNYFYPDLAKGYQISQYDQPFCVNGYVTLKSEIRNLKSETNFKNKISNSKTIRIRRVHLEEDTGKLLHATIDGKKVTLIDFNRSGVPLIEIVTEPNLRSSEQAKEFVKKLHQIIRYLGISDADMEKGSMRLEPNISVREIRNPKSEIRNQKRDKNTSDGGRLSLRSLDSSEVEESELPQYKVEVKNINSFNFAKKAIDYEIERHKRILIAGKIPVQETRGWDEKTGSTISQRSKEEAQDYRYFPDPDIPPVRWSKDQISKIKNQIGELPDAKRERFIRAYMLPENDATILTDEKETAEYFEKVISYWFLVERKEKEKITHKMIANWIINKRVDITKTAPEELIQQIKQRTQVVSVDEVEQHAAVDKVIEENSNAVVSYKAGKTSAIMFLVGQVMRGLKGQADPQRIRKILLEKLK